MASAANQLNNALTELTIDKELPEAGCPFLRLPVELRTKVVDHLSKYSELKALCLVSKLLSDLATPRLYYRVDLSIIGKLKANQRTQKMNPRQKEFRLVRKISSLLMNPANLQFVRVLKTGQCGTEPTILMYQILLLLQKDSLKKFSYSTQSNDCFPTPVQMQLLWRSQRHLKNLKLYSHIVPALETFLEEQKSSQSLSLESFTKLEISDRSSGSVNTPTAISWPFKNLNLSHLKSLCINGDGFHADDIESTLNNAFADGSFVNLSKLSFKMIGDVRRPLTLINVPLLESILIEYSGRSRESLLPLALMDNIRLKSFTYKGKLSMLTPFLAEIQGLERFLITSLGPVYKVDETILDLVRAVVANGETLRVFKLKANLQLSGEAGRSLWDTEFVKKIRLCNKLVDLALPTVEKPTSYFCDLITSFPHLSSLTIYTTMRNFFPWSSSHAWGLFPAFTQLESVLFKCPRLYPEIYPENPSTQPRINGLRPRYENNDWHPHAENYGWHRRCFLRQ